MKGKFEKAVERSATCIDGSNTRRRKNDMLLVGMAGDVTKECGFTRPCFSCEEKRVAGKTDKLEGGLLPPGILIYINIFFFSIFKIPIFIGFFCGFFFWSLGFLTFSFSFVFFFLLWG